MKELLLLFLHWLFLVIAFAGSLLMIKGMTLAVKEPEEIKDYYLGSIIFAGAIIITEIIDFFSLAT